MCFTIQLTFEENLTIINQIVEEDHDNYINNFNNDLNWLSYKSVIWRSNVLQAVLVQFPSIDFTIVVSINLLEEVLEVLLNHFFVEESMWLELILNPHLELSPLENIASVSIVLEEDIFNEFFAELIHKQQIIDISYHLPL